MSSTTTALPASASSDLAAEKPALATTAAVPQAASGVPTAASDHLSGRKCRPVKPIDNCHKAPSRASSGQWREPIARA